MPSSRLRRLTDRFRQQDWTSVAIDLIILVLGVFLGIQAANWNEERQQRAGEKIYLRQMIEDLQQDVRTLDTAVERSRFNDRAAEDALAIMDGTALPPADGSIRWARNFQTGGFLYLPRPMRRTYDEMIGSGRLAAMRNAAAKEAIMTYYASWDEVRQWDPQLRAQQQDYWRATAGLLPRRVLVSIFENVDPVLTAAERDEIVRDARQRPEMRRILISMAAHQARVRRDSRFQKRDTLALIRLLEPLAAPAPVTKSGGGVAN